MDYLGGTKTYRMAQSIPLPVRKDSLGEKLKNYSVLAGSILASSLAAQGQVVYTDVIPDVTLGGTLSLNDTTYTLDLNNDGTFEFNIVLTYSGTDPLAPGPSFHETMNGDFNVQNNKILIYRTGIYYPVGLKVPCGNDIPATSYFYGSQFAGLSWQVGAVSADHWNNIHDRVVGLKFKIGTDVHYGWVRLDMNTLDSIPNIVIKDYAYEATALQSIVACDTLAVGIPHSNTGKNEVSIFPNPSDGKCVFKFENPLKNRVEITVTDVFGKDVYGTNMMLNSQQHQLSFDFSHLASGIYFIQLKSEEVSFSEKWIKK
jgi:hypothetical protein